MIKFFKPNLKPDKKYMYRDTKKQLKKITYINSQHRNPIVKRTTFSHICERTILLPPCFLSLAHDNLIAYTNIYMHDPKLADAYSYGY